MLKVLLVGGTGCISSGISELACQRGNIDLYLLNRGRRPYFAPPGAHTIVADITQAEDVRAKIKDLHFDVVADFLSYGTEQLTRTLDIFRGFFDQFIFISSAAVYRTKSPGEIITEAHTMVGNTLWSYGRNKILCERLLKEEHDKNGLAYTIVRPSFTYNHLRLLLPVSPPHQEYSWTMANRMLQGKSIPMHDDGTAFCTVTHVSDFAKAFLGLCGNSRALGEAFHITSDEYYTWNRIAEIMAQALGVQPRLCHIPAHDLGFELGGDFGEKLISFANNAFLDSSKVRALVPEFVCTTHLAEGIQDCIRFYQDHPAFQVIDREFDRKMDDITEKYDGR